MPPLLIAVPRRKFFKVRRVHLSKSMGGRKRGDGRTKRVIARVYRARMKRNLKKCAGSSARPAIQYVLLEFRGVERLALRRTHMLDTIIVGISLKGTTSKMKREMSHAVGLLSSISRRRCADLRRHTCNTCLIVPGGRVTGFQLHYIAHSGKKRRSGHPITTIS